MGNSDKIDTDEAYQPIRKLIYLLFIINFFAIIIICLIAWLGSSFIAKPLENLRETVKKMKEGDLSVRAEAITNDEVGSLAKSYNDMADSLQRKIIDLDNFIYTASHDLKAPISNIEGLVATLPELYQKPGSEKEFKEIMIMLDKSIERFKNTIKDLGEVARIQKNLGDETKEANTSVILEEVKVLLRQEISSSKAEINILCSELPVILYSPKDLRSILINLIGNSIKYRKPESTPIINVDCVVKEEYVILVIQDNGLGIPAEKLDHIYEMFRRFHDHVSGSGIGLYIVKRIVDNNGDKIEVSSEVGKGTTFKIYFKNFRMVP